MPDKMDVVEWSELIEHAEKQGFNWNYAHDIVRIFQHYDRASIVGCGDIEELNPLDDPFIKESLKDDIDKYDLNQMGRDIVYHFMQTHNLKSMLVVHI
jgi:hypothetical protein